MAHTEFDFAGLKRAFETPDISSLITYYADDAEWLEYKPGSPVEPRRLMGKEAILAHVQGAADYGVKLEISDEIISDTGIAFCMTVKSPDGKHGIENVLAQHRDGKIVRQIDVEVWD